MPAEHCKVRIGDVALINGDVLNGDWLFPHIRYIDISSVGEGSISVEPQLLALSEAPGRAKRRICSGDTVLSTVRPNRRSMFFAKNPGQDWIVSTGFAVIRPKPEAIEPRFLYACIFDRSFTEYLVSREKGAAYPAVSPEDIVDAEIPLPPPAEQRAIAAVFGALDDKIELNHRMNETLEALAQSLFKSWFVDATKDGLPKDWSVDSVLRHATLLSGGTPKTECQDYWNGDIGWASAKDVSQCGQTFLIETERTITQKGLEESATQIIPRFCTVVVARGATTGRMVIFGREMAMNQTCYALHTTTETPFTLYCQLRHEMADLVHKAHGSVFDTITTSTFASSSLVLPPKSKLTEFEKVVSPIFHRILANTEESRTLAALRDALLPKLLAGELRMPLDEPVKQTK